MQSNYQIQSKTKIVATILTLIVVAGIVVFADHLKAQSTTASVTASTSVSTNNTSTTASPTASEAAPTTSTSATVINDGTYTASSSYYVPHGSENIQVTITLKDGVVTDSSIVNSEGDHDSVEYQTDFANSYKSYVVGKSISGLQLSRVSGASDTTQGFNDALQQILTKAEA